MHHIAEIARIRPVTSTAVMDWLTDHGIMIRDALREAPGLPSGPREEVVAVLVNSGLMQAPTWRWALDQLGLKIIEPLVAAIETGLVEPNVEISEGITLLEELLDRQMFGSAEIVIRKGFRFSVKLGPEGENIFHRLARDGNTHGLIMLLPVTDSAKKLRSPNDADMTPADIAADIDRHDFMIEAQKYLDQNAA